MQLNNLNLNLLKQLNVKEYKNLMLSNLKIGDVFKAQVINISNNSLSLRLPDGSVINASSLIEFNIKTGDFLDLQVHQKTETQTHVQIVNNKTDENINTLKIESKLAKLDIPVNDKNIHIGKQIQLNNLAFTKENFNKIIQVSNQSSIDKAVFLTANNISEDRFNLNMLNDLVDHKHTLGDNLIKLNNLLNDFLNNDKNNNFKNESINRDINIIKKAVDIILTDKKVALPKSNNSPNDSSKALINQVVNIDNNSEKNVFTESNTNEIININNSNKITNELLTNNKRTIDNDIETKNIINNKEPEQQLNIKDIIKNLFINVSKDKSEVLKEEINIKNLYNKILNISKALKTEFAHVGDDKTQKITSTINNIERELNFIGQLTRFNSYFQIPININGYDTTAELFVFEDGKSNKKIDPEDSSLFISLDTQNLGTVESYIKVKNKNIECTFRNNKKKVLDIIKSNSMNLYKLLESYGYKLTQIDYKIISHEDKCNILNCKEIKNRLDRKYSIDYKV